MKSSAEIAKIIEEVFTCYDSSISLLEEFLKNKTHIQEIILLCCARLDSLANLAIFQGSQKQRFTNFLLTHSSSRTLLERVSVPDLYFYLRGHLWMLAGTIEKPGRMHLFFPDDDKEFVTMVWNSDLAITEQEIGRLLKFLLRKLSSKFRVVANQSSARPTLEEPKRLLAHFANGTEGYRKGAYLKAVENLKHLIDNFRLANLLYKEYRCGAVHQHRVVIDRRDFFTAKLPYWQSFHNEFLQSGGFLKIQFPGPFLHTLFLDALANFKKALQGKKRLPAEIFYDVFDPLKDAEYLDQDSLIEGKATKISF